MKPHLPRPLRHALFACFSATCVCSATFATATLTGGLLAFAAVAPSAYGAYNTQTQTFEGTNNASIDPTASSYSGVELLIFNMGTAGTGNHLSNASWTYAGNIQIGAEGATTTGLCLNNGNSSKVNVFTGKVTGSGLLSKTGAGRNLTVAFEGDVTEFTGDIRLASTVPFTLRFGAGGNAVAGATAAHGVSGTGDIYFEGSTYDTVIYNFAANAPVYITNCIHTAAGATSRVELNGGGAYVLTKDAEVSQLTLGGTSSLQIGTEDIRSEMIVGSLTMAEGAAVLVENGKLTLSDAAPLTGRYEVGTHGVLQLEHTTTLNGVLTVAEGGALAVGPIAGFDTDAGAYDVPADGTNGFAAVNGKLALLEGEDELLQALAGTDVIFGGQRLKLAADGTVMLSDSDYTVYYLRHGEASLAALMEESHQLLTSVQVSAGAKLAVETGAVQGAFSYGESRVLGVNGVEPTMTGETHVEHLLATTALTVGNGATLTIGSTAEGNAADININTNGHLVFAAAEPTEMSVGSINNNGDLRNNFERTVLVEEGVTLHAASFINSWGMKSLTVNGELVVEDVLGYSTGSNSAGTNLLTGTGTVTVGELNIGNVSTSNTFDVRSLHVLGNANIGSNATISGGTVTIDGSVTMVPTVSKHTSFVLTVAGGHLILGDDVSDTVTLNHSLNISSGSLTLNGTAEISGTLTQTGGSITNNGSITVSGALSVSSTWDNTNGSINFNPGAVLNLTDLTGLEGMSGYTEGENGFIQAGSITVFRGGSITGVENVTVNNGAQGAVLTENGSVVLLGSESGINQYFLNVGSKTLSSIVSAANGNLGGIRVKAGTTLVVDEGEVMGRWTFGSDRTIDSETPISLVSGDTHVDNLLSTAALTVGNSATLTIGSTAEGNAADIDINTNGHLVFAAAEPTEMSVGTIKNNGDQRNNYVRTVLVEEGVTLHAASFLNSWGLKSLTVNGELDIEGTLYYSTGANSAGTNLLTGTGTVTAGELNIGNVSTSNTFDVHSLHVLGNANIGSNATISGGTVTIDGSLTMEPTSVYVTSLVLTVDGGHLILGDDESDTAVFGGTVNLSSGSLTINGTATDDNHLQQTGGVLNINGALKLNSPLTSSGTINLNGSLQVNSSVMAPLGEVTYSEGRNGYKTASYILLNKGGDDFRLVCGEGSAVLLEGANVSDRLTTDASGNIILTSATGRIYYVNEGTAVFGGDNSTIDTERAVGVALNGGNLTLNVDSGKNCELNLFSAAVVTLGGGCTLNSADVTGTQYLTLDGSGTYIVSTPAGVTDIHYAASWSGDTLVQAHLDNAENNELALNNQAYLGFSATPGSVDGGAMSNVGVLTMNDNGEVSFLHNSVTAAGRVYGGAIDNRNRLSLSANGNVSFVDNSAVSGESYALGGAIYNNVDVFTLTDNENVSFIGNTVQAQDSAVGGAICNNNSGSFVISGNQNITFTDNAAHSIGGQGNGGAISSSYNFALSDNGTVIFGGNSANSYGGAVFASNNFALSANESVIFEGNSVGTRGGAIFVSSTGAFEMNDNESVIFENNRAGNPENTGYGAAIDCGGTMTVEGNGFLAFRNNSIAGTTSGAYGAAIRNGNTLSMRENSSIVFSGNTAVSGESYARGGAMYNESLAAISMTDNGDISFADNVVRSEHNIAYGGALYNGNELSLSGNQNITFSHNTVESERAAQDTKFAVAGGAVFNSGTLHIDDNAVVSFIGNRVSTENAIAGGGAIFMGGASNVSLCGNGAVVFRDNTAVSENGYARGGAIDAGGGTFTLSGNGDVLFERNAEIENGIYRLRSIFFGGALVLSASQGHSITFKDSISAGGEVSLNQEGTGDIVFTGASTESDLFAVKGSAGTAEEILNSRTAEISMMTNLYGGRLIVENQAVLQGHGITVAEDSGATVRVKDATLAHSGSALTFNRGTTLEIEGTSSITASSVDMQTGSTLSFVLGETNLTTAALTLNGTLNTQDLTLSISGLVNAQSTPITYALLTVDSYDTTAWTADAVTIATDGVRFDDLEWNNGTLYLHYVDIHPNGSIVYTTRQTSALTLTGYVSIGFLNTVYSTTASAYGGAIYNGSNVTSSLSENGAITFSGNSASGSEALGGAIYSGITFTLSNNRDVTFSENSASATSAEGYGGAIYNGGNSTFTLSGNGDVTFSNNSASSANSYAYGGAIYNRGTFTLSGNENVTFSGNVCSTSTSLSDAQGGAIYHSSRQFSLNDNGYVIFNGNAASSSKSSAEGGAIYNSSTFKLCGNRDVSFSGNSASGSVALGGAIYNSGTFSLSGNGDVSFSGNTASSTKSSYGGAIHNNGTFTLSGNGDVTFSGNTASSTNSNAYGGAIYIYNGDSFTLSNNGDVLFEKNVEQSGATYRLRSIYSTYSFLPLELAASEGKSITFRDSVYSSGTVFLNPDYTDAANVVHKSTGDIVFSGTTTEDDLREMKGGVVGTATEILNSRTSTIAKTDLYRGRLVVEEGAILTGWGITVKDNANATIRLNNGAIDESGYTIAVSSGSWLEFEGANTLTASAIQMADGAALNFVLGDSTAPLVNINATLMTGKLSITLSGNMAGTHQLISLNDASQYDLSQWTEDNITIYGASFSDFSWNAGVLTYRYTPQSVIGSVTYTMRQTKPLTLEGYEGILFKNIVYTSSSSDVYGGAVSNYNSTFTLSGNGDVTFSGNVCSTSNSHAQGGAIYNDNGTFTLCGNREVTFSENSASSTNSTAYAYCAVYGGAIYNYNATFKLSGNGDVTFIGNTASSTNSDAYGGAIYHNGTFTLSGNGDVTFSENSASSTNYDVYGGAIYNNGTFTLSGNESVTFSGNTASSSSSSSSSYVYGGAIYNKGTFSLNDNGYVIFNGNAASSSNSSSSGGAIYNDSNGTFTLSGNGDVFFSGNTASSTKSSSGGAVLNKSTFKLSGNGDVTFSGNTASSTNSNASGGAIYNNGTFELSGNGDVFFSGNTASSTKSSSGGAIYNDSNGTFELSGNGDVTFSNNSASSANSYASGGAIYNRGTFSLSENGDVLFEKNVEQSGTTYRLRSIDSNGALNLAASEGKSITFRDSVYAWGTVTLNQDYSDAAGVVHKSKGDIIFTGATTEADLREVKGGIDGTAEEILKSRTSEIATSAKLYGGRLIVEDKAILKGRGITAAVDSGATVRVKDATLDHSGSALTFNRGTTLEIEGISSITASSVDMQAGSTLSFVLCETNLTTAALTLNGTLNTEALTLSISGLENEESTTITYALLNADSYDTTVWTADKITIATEGVSFENLVWDNGTLYYRPFSSPIIEGPMEWTLAKGVWTSGGSFGDTVFEDGDDVCFRTAANVTISGEVMPGEMLVAGTGSITFTTDKLVPESGISGSGTLTKEGESSLTLNAGNTYSGGTVLNGGTIKVTAADSLGDGTVTINGGTLDLGGQAVANDIVLSGEALIKGDAKYEGSVLVEGDATLLGKTSYKGTTTIDVDSSLTLADSVTIAGDIVVTGGTLNILNPKGLNLTKNTSLMLESGSVNGLLNVGAGTTLVWEYGTFTADAPVLNGGIVDLGGNSELVMTGANAAVQFGDKTLSLIGKGTVLTYEALTVKNGTVSVTSMDDFYGDLAVESGTLKLATGKVAVDNTIYVTGNAAVVNGTAHYGDIVVDGTLTKETSIKLLTEDQRVTLNGSGAMFGTISGTGLVVVNGDVDITGATLANADIRLSGTLTHTKGWTLAKGQTLTLDGGSVNGTLTIGAGSVLEVNGQSMESSPLLKGGTIDFGGVSALTLTGDKAVVCMEEQQFSLLGKGMVNSDSSLVVNGGAVSVNDFGGNESTVEVQSGTLKLVTGKAVSNNTIYVSGNAAVVNGATHYGDIVVDGTLTSGTSIKLLTDDQRVELNGSGAIFGSITGMGLVAVNGDVDITAASLSNADILLSGSVTHEKGWTLAKDQTLTLDGGSVNGTLTVGTGAVLEMNGQTLDSTPVLKGGTVDFGGSTTLTLTGTNAAICMEEQHISLLGKSMVNSDASLKVNGGVVTVNDFGDNDADIEVQSGTLKLAIGKKSADNAIHVSGDAAVVNGTTHYGDIVVDGTLTKETGIKLLSADQCVELNGAGALLGTISGAGIVNVNADIDATAAKLTAMNINLYNGTFTNTKGIALAKGQTLTLAGASLNLGLKGVLATVAGSTLVVGSNTHVEGSLTLGGGTLIFDGGSSLEVSGTLTLSKAMTVSGSGVITYTTLKAAKNADVEKLFGKGTVLDEANHTLTFGGARLVACAAPEMEIMSLVAAAEEPIEEEPESETTTAPALVQVPATPSPEMLRPAGDAMVQADWAILDANRAFVNTLQGRRDSGVLLADGQGVAWASAMGGVSRHGSENGHNGADVNLSGAAVGVEHTAGANSTLGLAVGHTWGRIGATGVQNLRQDTAHVALYGQTKLPHGFTAEWSAAYGDTSSKGTFYGSRETWSQRSTALSARISKTQSLNDSTAVRGFAGVNYDATDAGTLETVHTGSVQRLQGEVGAGITHRADKLTTYAEISLTADIDRHTPTVDFGTFRQGGANPGRTGLNLTLGAAYELNDKWSVNASYHVETAARNTQHSINVGAGRKF